MSEDFFGLPTHINGKQYPYEIHNPMMTQLSIARFYGGINYNGVHYVWVQHGTDPHAAVLVREDVDNARAKAAAKARKSAKAKNAAKQTRMPLPPPPAEQEKKT